MMVKICGITNVEDAQAAVEAGAGAIGFNFFPKSPRYLTPEQAASIAGQLPPEVLKVGVFVDEPPETVLRIVIEARLDVAQLHGDEPPGEWPENLRIWKALRANPDEIAGAMELWRAEAFLLDTPATGGFGGTGRSFDWRLAAGLPGRIILAGGLDASNVAEAIRAAAPWGVDASSRLECAPGRKDHDKVRQFVRAALSESL